MKFCVCASDSPKRHGYEISKQLLEVLVRMYGEEKG